jgi:hypothetical protein
MQVIKAWICVWVDPTPEFGTLADVAAHADRLGDMRCRGQRRGSSGIRPGFRRHGWARCCTRSDSALKHKRNIAATPHAAPYASLSRSSFSLSSHSLSASTWSCACLDGSPTLFDGVICLVSPARPLPRRCSLRISPSPPPS